MIRMPPAPALPLLRRHPTEHRMRLEVVAAAHGKLLDEPFELPAIARKLHGFGPADLLIHLRPRLHAVRPLHRRLESDPFDHDSGEWRRHGADGYGTHHRAERVAQVA